MSLIFAEHVRGGIRDASALGMRPDGIEFVAVTAAIFQMVIDRLYHDYDFPQNWKRDPEAYTIFMKLVIMVLIEWAPGDKAEVIAGLRADMLRESPPEPEPEPRTNREREFLRRTEAQFRSAWREDRPYNPARFGNVRKHTEAELNQYIDGAARRAGEAMRQWRAGTPLEQIDA